MCFCVFRHTLLCGIELTFPRNTRAADFKISVVVKSGLQHEFNLDDAEQLLSDILCMEPSGSQFDKVSTVLYYVYTVLI